jgi:DNA-binding FadR family transcriptional regulator
MSVGQERPRLGQTSKGQVKTSLRVARNVIRDIVTQDLKPGTRLPGETVLMESFGVSRSSMREALRILETNGFISVRPGPGGGPLINEVDPTDFGKTTAMFLQMSRTTLAEVFEARRHLEPLIAGIAAEHPRVERLEPLRESLKKHAEYTAFEPNSYLELIQDFHVVLTDTADSDVLGLFSLSLQSIVRERVAPVRIPSNRWREVIDEHRAIATAVLDGNPETAQRLMKEHMGGFCATYRRRYPTLIDEVIDGD